MRLYTVGRYLKQPFETHWAGGTILTGFQS